MIDFVGVVPIVPLYQLYHCQSGTGITTSARACFTGVHVL